MYVGSVYAYIHTRDTIEKHLRSNALRLALFYRFCTRTHDIRCNNRFHVSPLADYHQITSTSDHGACVLYDVDQFRVKVHVLTLLFKIGAVICVIVLYVVVVRWQRKKVINRTDRVPDQQEAMLFDISTQDNNDSTSNRTPEVLQ